MNRKRGKPLLKRRTTLATYLTNARLKADLSQDKAGKMIGKDKSFICRFERSIKTPPPHILRALAGIYDILPERVLNKAGYKEMPLLDIIKKPDNIPDSSLLNTTSIEKRELKRYLAFMRLTKSK